MGADTVGTPKSGAVAARYSKRAVGLISGLSDANANALSRQMSE